MKQIFIIASIFLILGCSSVSGRHPASIERAPASETSFESMSLCSRLKYLNMNPKVAVKDLPANFERVAFDDSRKVWNAAALMTRDTDAEKNSCMPIQMVDLVAKPEWCKSPGWAGPYISQELAKSYENMAVEDFNEFKDCWNKR